MIRGTLQKLIREACVALNFEAAEIAIEHPENPEHGDYSTNVALVLAKKLNKSPKEVAESIVSNFARSTSSGRALDLLDKVEVAGPGFINFFLSKEYFLQESLKIIKQKNKYGAGKEKKKIIVEYSS